MKAFIWGLTGRQWQGRNLASASDTKIIRLFFHFEFWFYIKKQFPHCLIVSSLPHHLQESIISQEFIRYIIIIIFSYSKLMTSRLAGVMREHRLRSASFPRPHQLRRTYAFLPVPVLGYGAIFAQKQYDIAYGREQETLEEVDTVRIQLHLLTAFRYLELKFGEI